MFESKLSGLVEGKQNQLKKAAEFVINGFLIILLEILREKKKKRHAMSLFNEKYKMYIKNKNKKHP